MGNLQIEIGFEDIELAEAKALIEKIEQFVAANPKAKVKNLRFD